jgi:hypothetical protein
MATVGPKLTVPFTVGTDKIVGQGGQPELWVLYSTDDASAAVPTWTDATPKMKGPSGSRSWNTARGRESERAEMNAGTATLTLDNRDRTFDPVLHPEIRLRNRWWVREQFSGETQDLFKGRATSYVQEWPDGMDAQTSVSIVDETGVLARNALPVTDPPRDGYADVVLFDKPSGYWRMDDIPATLAASPAPPAGKLAVVGRWKLAETWVAVGSGGGSSTLKSSAAFTSVATPIVGDRGAAIQLSTNAALSSLTAAEASEIAPFGLAEFTIELWFYADALPAAADVLITGPFAAGAFVYKLEFDFTGVLTLSARNVSATDHVITSGGLSTGTWYHIVGTVTGGFLRLYVNAVHVSSTAFTPPLSTVVHPSPSIRVGDPAAEASYRFDEVAFYRQGLSTARVEAHYEAGTSRGYGQQNSGTRIASILDTVGSDAPRQIRAGVRDVLPITMRGQPPLDEMRNAVKGEAVDGVLFVAKDGTITFLDAGHRSVSPWNTVQATFDDDGTDLPYLDLVPDYSDSFLVNEWNVTKDGGTLQTARDAASIAAHDVFSESLTGLPILTDTDALNIATALLAKTKNPITRVLSLSLDTSNADVAEAVFRLDIGSRIRIFRTPPGGGARFDQTLWVQSIKVGGSNDGKPWSIQLGVSPL